MKLLATDKERSWYLVKEFTTKNGLPARIHQCVWNDKIKSIVPRMHDHYTGYVKKPTESGVDYDSDDVRNKIVVHGGITFSGELFDIEGEWVGFDMAHLNDENIPNPEEYAEEQCEILAEQII